MRKASTDEQTKRNEKWRTSIQQTISKQASAHFSKADPELGKRVAKGLKL
jgi:catalase